MADPVSAAIYMLAWGVLDFAPSKALSVGEYMDADSKQREVLDLIQKEFKQRGWLLERASARARTRWTLYGDIEHSFGVVRLKIAEGTLREVCQATVAYDQIGTRAGLALPVCSVRNPKR